MSLYICLEGSCALFFDHNHIQGGTPHRGVALCIDGDIIFAASFGRRFGKFELIRCASRIGVRVPGGLARILSAVHDAFPGEKCLWSFVDRRFFTGASLRALGFRLEAKTPPNYVYVSSNGEVVGSRQKFQKHRLRAFIGDRFDPALTEEENMRNAGYYRRYDAGHLLLRLDI